MVSLEHGWKSFYTPPPINKWELCPLSLNLNVLLTAFINKIKVEVILCDL